eukprot:2725957-Pleurochrysis_carterae.AAC.1
MVGILVLLEQYRIGVAGDVDVEEIADGSLVLHVPSFSQARGKGFVQGTRAVRKVEDKEVVDVATHDDPLSVAAYLPLGGEDTLVVRGALREPPLEQPREEGPLPATARLSHAVDGLDHLANLRPPVGPEGP